MSSGIVAPDKRVSEEDPATPPRPKRANNKDSPTREAGPAPADPENVTLSQLQVVPPPQKSRAIVPNKEWAQSIVSLCLIVPDEWWPEYSGDRRLRAVNITKCKFWVKTTNLGFDYHLLNCAQIQY